MLFFPILFILHTAALVLTAPSKERAYQLKQEISPPSGWVKHSKPAPYHNIVLRFGLPQSNFLELEKHLYEVSDPDHERYGQYLSKEHVDALVAPPQESLDLVDEWLATFGLSDDRIVRSTAKDWITLTVPISLAEKMLDTTYHVWKHTDSNDYLVRTTSYSLPTNLHDHIEVVQPTTMFGRFNPQNSILFRLESLSADHQADTAAQVNLPPIVDLVSGLSVDGSCRNTITLSCLKQIYNAVGYIPSSNDRNSIGVTGYMNQFANLDDLQTFYSKQLPDAVNSSFKFISVNGGLNTQDLSRAGGEADLDVQFAFGLSHPIPATFYSTAGAPPFNPDNVNPTNHNEPYIQWLEFMNSQQDPPLVISTSYGDDEQTVPMDYAVRGCAEFAKLGARGVSLIFASGDSGVGDGNPDPATQQCQTNDGRNVTAFIPTFPSGCPYVTSVGGTTGIPEVAVSSLASGGGFSNYFKRPKYQDAAVTKYLNALPKGLYQGLFNPSGRAYPDVSAQSDNFLIQWRGGPNVAAGTSAAAPTFAAFIAMLNDARIRNGQKALGMLNPFLYSRGIAGLNDITSGSNPGCGTQGFNATKGWDPVTGLGTPNFGKLKTIVTAQS
ncbi:subtilisin-like protein [Phlegmacium glaucopus]|nr:subtilisin-like protein [Phlegmacium glaucopus]